MSEPSEQNKQHTADSETDPRVDALRASFPQAILDAAKKGKQLVLKVSGGALVPLCRQLRDDAAFRFDYLADLTAVDAADGLRAVYRLYSITSGDYAQILVPLDESNPRIASVSSVWPGAIWQEREAFDMFGIVFEGHPDLRRILLPEDWIGHPLRKSAEGKEPKE